jgi:hypothetical protein
MGTVHGFQKGVAKNACNGGYEGHHVSMAPLFGSAYIACTACNKAHKKVTWPKCLRVLKKVKS